MRTARRARSPVVVGSLALVIALSLSGAPAAVGQSDDAPGPRPATTLLDLSGLALTGTDQLVAVHDAKNPDENDRPRASLLTLTRSPVGISWEPITIDWPADLGPANDLESASAVPGSPLIVLAESGDDGGDAVVDFQRLFFVELDATAEEAPSATLVGVATWPEPVTNVEGMAVARVADELVLVGRRAGHVGRCRTGGGLAPEAQARGHARRAQGGEPGLGLRRRWRRPALRGHRRRGLRRHPSPTGVRIRRLNAAARPMRRRTADATSARGCGSLQPGGTSSKLRIHMSRRPVPPSTTMQAVSPTAPWLKSD